MKTLHPIGLLTAMVAGLTLVAQADPQYKPTGDDGITASPKVRAQLNERYPRQNTAAAPSTAPSMACPKCKDEFVSVPVQGAKGGQILLAGGIPTQKTVRHLCPGCDTTISVAGTGKAKHSLATHTCTASGADSLACCSSEQPGKAGMKTMENKPVQIAPVK